MDRASALSRRWVWLDDLPITPGSAYIMDRGYINFRHVRPIAQTYAFFVIRDAAGDHIAELYRQRRQIDPFFHWRRHILRSAASPRDAIPGIRR